MGDFSVYRPARVAEIMKKFLEDFPDLRILVARMEHDPLIRRTVLQNLERLVRSHGTGEGQPFQNHGLAPFGRVYRSRLDAGDETPAEAEKLLAGASEKITQRVRTGMLYALVELLHEVRGTAGPIGPQG